MSTATNRFAPGTFTPDPRPAAIPAMLAAQYSLELKLLLRNGEPALSMLRMHQHFIHQVSY